MAYKFPIPLPWPLLVGPLGAAEDALSRLDERLRVSPIREGWIARTHFLDACASAWVDGELVHVEDLVLHDANMDIRWPTHELTRAHSVLRARRRIFQEGPQWALSPTGLNALVGRVALSGPAGQGARRSDEGESDGFDEESESFEMSDDDPLARQFAGLEVIGQRAKRLLSDMAAGPAESQDPMIYDPDWDEKERLASWREALDDSESLPPLLGAALALLAWGEIEPLQHRAWLGRLLAGAMLRARSRTQSHLLCLNTGLRLIPWERRRAPDPTTKLVAVLDGFAEAARWGMKEHDRWLLARRRLDRRLVGRRSNSSLPALVELVIARPILSTGLIARELKVTPRAAQDLVAELDLREMTGRGRYRAWGIL
jgi:Protein of unknown function (DUF1612)/HTH DNA binding domain